MKSLICLVLLSLNAHALENNFKGKWSGSGKKIFNLKTEECEKIFMHLEFYESKFYIVSGGYKCGSLEANYPFSDFTIGEYGVLTHAGKRVGHIDKNQIMIEDEDAGFSLFLILKNNQLQYIEEWVTDTTPFIITGNLDK